jgi:hypothetical protein
MCVCVELYGPLGRLDNVFQDHSVAAAIPLFCAMTPPLDPDYLAALIDLRVAELRVLAAQTAVDFGREESARLYDKLLEQVERWASAAKWDSWYRSARWSRIRRYQLLRAPAVQVLPSSAASSRRRRFAITSNRIVATSTSFGFGRFRRARVSAGHWVRWLAFGPAPSGLRSGGDIARLSLWAD